MIDPDFRKRLAEVDVQLQRDLRRLRIAGACGLAVIVIVAILQSR